MQPLDWLIVVLPLIVVAAVGWRTQRHVRSVADFMAGGRVAGRYLVAVSDGMAALGLITVVAMLEFYYNSGFAVGFWGGFSMPVALVITLTGFVIYRFRQTRALTLAQFLEARYSRRFRVFAGFLSAAAGIINYGIFPAVAGHFFVHYCGLPEMTAVARLQLPTFALAMAVFLSGALVLVLRGGQLTIMATDCIQGVIAYAMYVAVALAILYAFSWGQMSEAMLDRPPGRSLIDPYDTYEMSDFNVWFILIGMFGMVYSQMAWQGNAGYNAAAASPHEQRMGKVLGTWRAGASGAMIVLIAVGAYTFMHHADFTEQATVVRGELDAIANDAVRSQATVPVVMRHVLPVGVNGAFLAVMLLLMLSTDVSYLHSWGSMVVQDVILPLRTRPFEPRQQIRWLRVSITAVAVFAFCFSLWFNQKQFILMFFSVTGAIYAGGAGSVIIGGLYWGRGTTAGAWGAMIVGAAIAVFGFVMEQAWPSVAVALLDRWPDSGFLQQHRERWFINGQYMWLLSMLGAIASYVTLSLLSCRQPCDLDRLLHRSGPQMESSPTSASTIIPRWQRLLLGYDNDFSRGDRLLSAFVFGWSMLQFTLFLGALVWSTVQGWPDRWWANYFWYTNVLLMLAMGVVTSVWFAIGGIVDLRRMFHRLDTMQRNVHDDGHVIGHANAEDIEPPPPEVVEPETVNEPYDVITATHISGGTSGVTSGVTSGAAIDRLPMLRQANIEETP